jgi:hypothetical protein
MGCDGVDLYLLASIATLAVVAGLTWFLPRRFGILGLLVAQAFAYVACFVGLALGGRPWWAWDGLRPMLFATFVQAAAFNFLMLPVALLAVWRRHRGRRRPPRRGFDVLPPTGDGPRG